MALRTQTVEEYKEAAARLLDAPEGWKYVIARDGDRMNAVPIFSFVPPNPDPRSAEEYDVRSFLATLLGPFQAPETSMQLWNAQISALGHALLSEIAIREIDNHARELESRVDYVNDVIARELV